MNFETIFDLSLRNASSDTSFLRFSALPEALDFVGGQCRLASTGSLRVPHSTMIVNDIRVWIQAPDGFWVGHVPRVYEAISFYAKKTILNLQVHSVITAPLSAGKEQWAAGMLRALERNKTSISSGTSSSELQVCVYLDSEPYVETELSNQLSILPVFVAVRYSA